MHYQKNEICEEQRKIITHFYVFAIDIRIITCYNRIIERR